MWQRINPPSTPVEVYSFYTKYSVKYRPDGPTCVHGVPDGTDCSCCLIFLATITTPPPVKLIAKTYPPDLGDPQALFTSLEDVAEFLLTRAAGLDITNPQERETPGRYVRALRDMTTPEEFKFTTFDVKEDELDEMVTVMGIPFSSLCRHHLLPFFGVVHIAYIPRTKMAGLSKFPRTVNFFSHRLQTQEELTTQIAEYLLQQLHPVGVAVALEAEHMCMTLRGVRAPGSKTQTQCMRGVFADHERTAKAEFLSRISGGK